VVFTIAAAPVLDITGSTNGLDYNLLFRFAKSQNKKYIVTGWYIQSFAELLPLHRANHAATQTFLCCTQENALGGYPMVTAKRPTYPGIAEYDYVGRWSLAFARARPVFEIAGPAKMRF